MARELLAGSATGLSLDLLGASEIEARLPPEAAHELLQIAREAVSNVARHSEAERAEVALRVVDGTATLVVQDDGIGFDPRRRLGSTHFGLANLRDRASAVAGTLQIESEPGKGTRIIVRLPLALSERPT
jgi:signal transduction histidine kinase